MITLTQLHADIEACVRAIRDDNHDWLCRLGCDGSPKYPGSLRGNGIGCGMDWPRYPQSSFGKSTRTSLRWLSCHHAPSSARYWTGRRGGLYCNGIKSRVADGDWTGCGGNQDAMDRRLCGLGDTRDLTEWFASWKEAGGMA
jgi:hypothetical protein